MSVVYDEIYISTKREISLCEKLIKKLNRIHSDLERKYHLKTTEFIERYNDEDVGENFDYVKWRSTYKELKNWEKRLKEHQEILQMAKH